MDGAQVARFTYTMCVSMLCNYSAKPSLQKQGSGPEYFLSFDAQMSSSILPTTGTHVDGKVSPDKLG